MDEIRKSQLADRLLDLGIKPHAEEIAAIAAKGDVAVVVFEPDPSIADALNTIGWDGESHVFRLSNNAKRRLVAGLDKVTMRWLNRKAGVRVFLFVQGGNLLVNLDERGWFIEPGSNDSGRAA